MRRKRKNAWPGSPRLHARAARKGWRRKGSRRTRRNAGSFVSTGTRSIGAAFNAKVAKEAGVILYGNISTTFASDYLQGMFPVLRSNAALDVLSVLGVASLNGYVTGKFRMTSKYAQNVLTGGLLAGVTRLLRKVLPGKFSTCGLGEDLEGFGDWTPSPAQFARPIMAGLGWAPGPGTPQIGTHGMGDSAVWNQTFPGNYQHQAGSPLVTLDGMGDADEMAGLA